jgi:hypothetical protein
VLLTEDEIGILPATNGDLVSEDAQPTADRELEDFHLRHVRYWFSLESGAERARVVTDYIAWLDACRADATAVRDIDVLQMKKHGFGAARIASAMDLNRSRGQQMLLAAAGRSGTAATRVSQLKRRVRRFFAD